MSMHRFRYLLPLLLTACAMQDSHIAHDAETMLMGMSEVDLESCLGAPDQHANFGDTDILTYYATSTSSDTWSLPLVGGFSFANGAYCHATFKVISGRVTQILYSGEKNATLAPDAYCAPIMRTCVAHLRQAASTTPRPQAPPGQAGAPQSGPPAATQPQRPPQAEAAAGGLSPARP